VFISLFMVTPWKAYETLSIIHGFIVSGSDFIYNESELANKLPNADIQTIFIAATAITPRIHFLPVTVAALYPEWDSYAIAINKGDLMEALETDCLLHPAEVARILQVSISWLAKTRLSGTGPTYVKIGRSVRYPAPSVRDFIKARTRTSTSGPEEARDHNLILAPLPFCGMNRNVVASEYK
jgi:predicted DNA-binding transcriptional regulator AlpA